MMSMMWRKSSRSINGTSAECVEVAELPSLVQGPVSGAKGEAREADGQALARR
jgi:hypothetical protein